MPSRSDPSLRPPASPRTPRCLQATASPNGLCGEAAAGASVPPACLPGLLPWPEHFRGSLGLCRMKTHTLDLGGDSWDAQEGDSRDGHPGWARRPARPWACSSAPPPGTSSSVQCQRPEGDSSSGSVGGTRFGRGRRGRPHSLRGGAGCAAASAGSLCPVCAWAAGKGARAHAGGGPGWGPGLSRSWRGGDGVWEENNAVRCVFYGDRRGGRVAGGCEVGRLAQPAGLQFKLGAP